MSDTLSSPGNSDSNQSGKFAVNSPSNVKSVVATDTPLTKDQLGDMTVLVKECVAFVEATKVSLTIPFAAFERVRQWRVKRRESKAMEAMDTLLPRVKAAEVFRFAYMVV
jgi:hypothetical protein